MKLQETNHSYYCSDSNYYVGGYDNFGRCEHKTWDDFKSEWLLTNETLDDDLNHLFRFDIKENEEQLNKGIKSFQLNLYFILQRKGIYRPVIIEEIKEEDMKEIEEFLKQRWNYMKNQWKEFSE